MGVEDWSWTKNLLDVSKYMLNMMYIINMYLQKLTYILIVLNVWELVEMLSLGLKKKTEKVVFIKKPIILCFCYGKPEVSILSIGPKK